MTNNENKVSENNLTDRLIKGYKELLDKLEIQKETPDIYDKSTDWIDGYQTALKEVINDLNAFVSTLELKQRAKK